jgi:hypothetical protein
MMECPSCRGVDCVQIEIRLKSDDSDTVRFFSCRGCEAKWWERDGDTIALDEVLDLTAQHQAR